MRRLLRWSFSSLSLVSAMLFAATCALWVRSYRGSDYIQRRRMTSANAVALTHESTSLACTHGEVRFSIAEDTLYLFHGPKWETGTRNASWSIGRLGIGHSGWESPPAQSLLNRLGFAEWQDGWESSFAGTRSHIWAGPAWLIASIWAILPAFWVRRAFRRWRRYHLGHCPSCGYDLRATRERCPECGTIPMAGRKELA